MSNPIQYEKLIKDFYNDLERAGLIPKGFTTKSKIFRWLTIEENTEEGRLAKELMDSSGLIYTLKEVDRQFAETERVNCQSVPRLLTNVAFCEDLEAIRWYAKLYGAGGKLHSQEG